MNDALSLRNITLSIAAVERDTGLSKDTLRVWERRYRFPQPLRDPTGERAYTLDQVEKLRALKRLLEAGHRPGRIVPLSMEELQQIAESTVDQATRSVEAALPAADVNDYIELIRKHDPIALREALERLLAKVGVARFVVEVLAPLNSAVGDAWLRNQVEVFEEHVYTETMQGVLRRAIAAVPANDSGCPTVLLTTIPHEPHGLGILMAEAMLALEGCRCVSLGAQTPIWDIVLAAKAYSADIVAIGFTGCLNPNQVIEAVTELRAKLPAAVQLWVGGSAPVLQRRRVDGVQVLPTIDRLPGEVKRWRAEARREPPAAAA
jgi:methanogenic corrinoid protein MtbC1